MSSDSQMEQSLGSGGELAVSINTEIMVGAISFVVIAFVFVFFLFLYSKRYWGVNSASGESRPRFVFSSDQAPLVRGGLDAAVVQALPITIFRSEDFKEGLDCSVCLSELSSGEEARLLPKCNHGFHVDCIDMWFHSHSTCPLCRSPVGPDPLESSDFGTELVEIPPPAAVSGDGQSTESPNFPTNVLFWGTQDRVSTGFSAVNGLQEGSSSSSSGSSSGKVEGMLVIEIPRRAEEGFPSPNSSLPSSRLPVEDMKSPTPARLRSLRRLLSRGKRGVGSSCSPRGGDIEQGVVGVGGAGEAGVPVLKTAMNS